MSNQSNVENKVKSWLEQIFNKENYVSLSVNISGNSEKGDGYMGDIVFASANITRTDQSTENYDLVLKCSKTSKAFRETSQVKEAFYNEICFYTKILPHFTQFQKEKGAEIFNCVPKSYGFVIGDNYEIIALDNLKKKGYELWPKKIGMTRKHVEMVLTEYGKFHATSLAFQMQYPEKFQSIINDIEDIFKDFTETCDYEKLFKTPILESYELLKNDLDENSLFKWKEFSNKVKYIAAEMSESITGLKVIVHGDCWNNNFMFLHDKSEEKNPLQVAIIDWQIIRYSTPIVDLSYFLFTCLAENDFNDLDDILNTYYQSFIKELNQLCVENPEKIYPQSQFLNEWKVNSKFGLLMAALLMKIVSTEKDEVLDMAQIAESGKEFTEAFQYEVKDKDNYKRRIRPIIEYAVKHNLL